MADELEPSEEELLAQRTAFYENLLKDKREAADNTDSVKLVLSVMDLPFVRVTTFDDKRLGTGYALVLMGARSAIQSWCHDPDKTDPPYFYHRSEDDARACFDEHHPGLRDAIAALEAERAAR